ncbi:MAG: ATPase domain-containing protein, partial [Telluria sp.]
ERSGAKRVVIDSLSEIELYLVPEVRADLRLAVFRTLSALAKRGVTALVTVGMEDEFTGLRFSPSKLSFLTDAVVSLRFAEFEGELRKIMTVVKVRGCDHSADIRQYTITDKGIELDSKVTGYDGLLTGQPVPRS